MKYTLVLFLLLPLFLFAQNLRGSNLIDTIIISGPALTLEDTKAVFKFQAIDYSLKKSQYFYFQTQLWPLEKTWQNSYSTERYYYLPKGIGLYILKVRAVNDKGYYDKTPAIYYFLTKTSEFYQDISISPSWDGMSLTLVNNTNKEINITDWQIRTSKIIFTIPKGVKDFNPDQSKRKEENIILPAYGRAVFYTVYSSATSAPRELSFQNIPLSPFGVNFLGNQCFSYLDKTYPSNFCDAVKYSPQELLNMVLTGKISRQCAILLQSYDCDGRYLLSRAREINDFHCQALVEDWYNYNSCYRRRSSEKDFYGKTWRIYFDPRSDYDKKERKPLERLFRDRFERIYLYDNNGLLVNKYDIF
ncbi:MAG: hypothetical protein KatS3mg093_194 [Candidatus Parcubacteria bacterium]|nr:MAG: hypothetical protein KatS3mg093_194 [Candidatus Parcubacteria bacterium]